MSKSPLLPFARLSEAAYLGENQNDLLDLALSVEGLKRVARIHKTTADLDTHCFVAVTADPAAPPVIHVGWQGTADEKNFLTDAEIKLSQGRFVPTGLLIHHGFDDAYMLVREDVLDVVKALIAAYPYADISTEGHSLGGALAEENALDLANVVFASQVKVSSRTFGSPRVGDHRLKNYYNSRVPDTIRCVHADDLVPQIPIGSYRHVGSEYHFTTDGKVAGTLKGWWRELWGFDKKLVDDLDGQALKEHSISRYITDLGKVQVP
jgi:Lipase (class 3)